MRKIDCMSTCVFALILFPIVTFASNSDDKKVLSLLGSALSTLEQITQNSEPAVDTTDAVSSGLSLTDVLVKQLGVSPQQALGGTGAIFQLAKEKMTPQVFSTLSYSIPGMSGMLEAAPAVSGSASNLTKSISSMLGGSNNTLGGLTSIATSFNELNLSPEMMGRFIPVITDYVKNTGGEVVADLLKSALTPDFSKLDASYTTP